MCACVCVRVCECEWNVIVSKSACVGVTGNVHESVGVSERERDVVSGCACVCEGERLCVCY